MIRSVWFNLSVYFTGLCIGITLIMVIAISEYWDYEAFTKLITPQQILEIISLENDVFAQAVSAQQARESWRQTGERKLSQALLNMNNDQYDFFLQHCADPQLYFMLFNASGSTVFSSPALVPEDIERGFSVQSGLWKDPFSLPEDGLAWEGTAGQFWVLLPLFDEERRRVGYIAVLFIAQFDAFKRFLNSCREYFEEWPVTLSIFATYGFLCGLAASRFFGGRLRQIDVVTSYWRQGDFSPRIYIPAGSRGPLSEHGKLLNAMADGLLSLFDLRRRMAVTEERNRMARELHDTVKQNLFALQLQLTAALNKKSLEDAASHIAEASEITKEAQQDLQEILSQLQLSVSDKGTFYQRLEALADDMGRRFGLRVLWEQKETVTLTQERVDVLIPLAREAFSNALRHGGASQVTMCLTRDGGRYVWEIRDNGVGFSEDQGKRTGASGKDSSQAGLGIGFMRERATHLPGGTFSIVSVPGEGIRLTISWDGNS